MHRSKYERVVRKNEGFDGISADAEKQGKTFLHLTFFTCHHKKY